MEMRQLEYFVISAEERSFYKASKKLFTSQPAVSKAIALLEKDVNTKLFNRTSRGITLTAEGERLYHYAKNILRQVDIMKTPLLDRNILMRLASYPSGFIASITADFFYREQMIDGEIINQCPIQLDYREGSVQDIIDFVANGISEVGIIYISENQENALKHILAHKNLEFISIKNSELCVYVGRMHSLYGSEEKISISELTELKYIRGVKDFFSVEHHFDYVSLNEINMSHFNDSVITNSDHLVINLLDRTDMCYLGINSVTQDEKSKILLDAEEKYLKLGYIKNKISDLSPLIQRFLEDLVKQI